MINTFPIPISSLGKHINAADYQSGVEVGQVVKVLHESRWAGLSPPLQ
jgi:hypothetical protein